MIANKFFLKLRSKIFMAFAGNIFMEDILIRVLWPRNWYNQYKLDKAKRKRFLDFCQKHGIKPSGKKKI